MSYQDGLAALNLEMPDFVPRTEYSAEMHWELIEAVTGIHVSNDSSTQQQTEAASAFMKAWNYGLSWNVFADHAQLGKYYSDMGHANYASEGEDFRPVGESVFRDEDDVLTFDAMECLGRKNTADLVKLFNNNYEKNCAMKPDLVNMTGIYITCMSGLIDLFGWDLLLTAAGIDATGFGQVTERYTEWIMQYFTALAQSDSPVVMIHDDIVWTSGAFLKPHWYRQYVFPAYKKLFAPLHEAGKKILFTSDGDYTEFIDDIAQCGINGFVMEPTTDMGYIAERYGKTHCIIGNADTRALMFGSREDIYAEVKRCMDIGKKCPGFFLAVGNHIPPNTPVESALYYDECYRKLGKR